MAINLTNYFRNRKQNLKDVAHLGQLAFTFAAVTISTVPLHANSLHAEEANHHVSHHGENLKHSSPNLSLNFAEQKDVIVRGVVNDGEGNPLPGASVVIKGTSIGTSTDFDGNFELKTSDLYNKTLVFSFIGMTSKEVVYKGQKKMTIVLSDDTKLLDEVVVTGYQTISKERATGAYSKIGDDILSKRPVTNITSALTGMVPGLSTNVDGNGNINLMVRGKGTLSGDSTPLIVVDGFAIDEGLESINPNDIQDITVLKDAASTSIYGARAANGVIVITTKRSKEKKIRVSYNAFIKLSDKYDLDYSMRMLDSKTQINRDRALIQNGLINNLPAEGDWRKDFSLAQSLLLENKLGRGLSDEELNRELERLAGYDYKDDVNKYLLRNAFEQQHNISIEGSSERNSFRLSVLYSNDLTGYKYNSINKGIITLNDLYKFNDKLTLGVNSTINLSKFCLNGSSYNEMRGLITPYQRLIDDSGNFTSMPSSYYGPYRQYMEDRMPYKNWNYNNLEEARNRDKSFDKLGLRLQTKLNYKINDNFNFSTQFQYTTNKIHNRVLNSEKTFYVRDLVNTFSSNKTDKGGTTYLYHPEGFDKGAILQESNYTNSSYNFRAQLDYKKSFGKHHLSFLLGTEVIANEFVSPPQRQIMGYDPDTFTGNTFDFTKDLVYHNRNQGQTNLAGIFGNGFRNETRTYNRFFSGYFNAAYSYDDKYTASLSMRTDASNFVSASTQDKFSPFWSIGSMWNIHKENFIRDNYDFINRLSLRSSFGVVGLPAARSSLSALTTLGYGINREYGENIPYANIISYGLSDLTWEKSYTFNVGVDFSMFRNKFYGSLEFYNKKSTDVISQRKVSTIINPNKILSGNFSDVLNRGVEMQLGVQFEPVKGLQWNSTLNASYNYNEVLKFDNPNNIASTYLGSNFFVEGRPTDHLYTYRWLGVDDKGAGIVSINGERTVLDKTIPSNNTIDYQAGETVDDFLDYQGRVTPVVYSSLINSLKYKNFSLTFIVSGKFGHKFMLPGIQTGYLSYGNYSASKTTELGWTRENPNTATPMTTPSTQEDADLMKENGNNWKNYYNRGSDLVRNASFIRFEEIYFGYDLPKSFLSKCHLNGATIYAQLKNVGLLWTANKENIDPEYIPRVSSVVKPPRTYTIGLNIKF